MIAAITALLLSAAPLVDVRDELPWTVSVVAGMSVGSSAGPCGQRRILAGVRGDQLQPVLTTTTTTTAPTFRVPLHWQAGLFGLDGDLFVVAAEAALRAARIEATVTLALQKSTAAIAVTTTSPAASVATALTTFAVDGRQFSALLQAAAARRAWRHSRVGVTAIEQVDAALCFPGAVITPATTTATAASIRAALAGPVVAPL